MATKVPLQYLLLFISLINLPFNFGHARKESWQTCPSEENIDDCVCKDYTNARRQLDCGYSYTVKEYVSRIRQMEIPENTKLDIKFFNLRKIPNDISSDSFNGLNVRSLKFIECNITSWADDVQGPGFVGLENTLEYLNIFKSIIRPRPVNLHDVIDAEFSLHQFKELKEIDFQRNTLWNFCNGLFGEGLEDSLERVTLQDNEIWYICDSAFSSLKKLKYINFAMNKIFEVSRNMLPNPAVYLKEMDVNFNKIRDPLPKDLFENMPALNKVNFNGNDKLFRLDERTWRHIWSQLQWLDFGVPFLSCQDKTIAWMFKVKRPEILDAKCYHPEERKGMLLRKIIDEKQKET